VFQFYHVEKWGVGESIASGAFGIVLGKQTTRINLYSIYSSTLIIMKLGIINSAFGQAGVKAIQSSRL
jgi:hypothetical protein